MSKYDKSISKILIILENLMHGVANRKDFFIELEIVTREGNKSLIKWNSNNKGKTKINKNMLVVNDKSLISLDDIIKIKILNTNMDKEIKDRLIYEIKDSVKSEYSQQNRGRNLNYNKRNNSMLKDRKIESLIRGNNSNIKTITFDGIKRDSIGCIDNFDNIDVLNNGTDIDIKKESVLGDIDILSEDCSVVSSVDETKESVVKNIEFEEKLVLTDKAKEIEVAKPIQVEELDIVTDIQLEDLNILSNPNKAKVIKDISESKSKAIINIDKNFKSNIVGNIDKSTQFIKPERINILDISPMNNYINKEEVVNKPLVLDPTGENYIGVILDDGTFEPLTITMKSITVMPEVTDNILININEENIISKVMEDISYETNDFFNSLDIQYNEDVIEDKDDKLKSMNEVIKMSNKRIKNILNEDETAFVTSKEYLESIKSIKDTENTLVSKINNIKNTDVINYVNSNKTQKDVIEDVLLNKKCNSVVENIEYSNRAVLHPNEENIDGIIEFVGNGIMLVNEELGITIYSTEKIKNINNPPIN
ncbi:hypothetical protein [Romboutsia sp. 1001713B170207_170306_H8]|uniref:hypothetical protein n=1 Tax=Romboutsia sp. 1001713B170207_170306_H8 TaxID=2787112 RepID=UPI0018985CED|nr:hypothetical protein [Romboutsia sp. 1001713B170207_170306_H8]